MSDHLIPTPTAILLAAAAYPQPLRHFNKMQPLEDRAYDSAGVHIGDLNGDGRLDIVLAKGRHQPLHNRVLLNDGPGGFLASNLGDTPDRTYSAALADLDLDGDLDIVVSNDLPDKKLIYLNDGKANFTAAGTYGQPQWSTRYVTVADLNGDRFPDVVAANRGQPSFYCLNNGKAAFPACQPLPTQSATSIVAADFDGDGHRDLFVPHRDGGQSKMLWNDGHANFNAATNVGPPTSNARIAAAADFDRDGRLDLAYIDERKRATFLVYGRGDRSFSDPNALPGPPRTPYALAIADLNKDQIPDVVVGYIESPGSIYFSGKTEVLWNDGKGHAYGMAFADLNGDGWPDIAAARSAAPNAIWLSEPPRR